MKLRIAVILCWMLVGCAQAAHDHDAGHIPAQAIQMDEQLPLEPPAREELVDQPPPTVADDGGMPEPDGGFKYVACAFDLEREPVTLTVPSPDYATSLTRTTSS